MEVFLGTKIILEYSWRLTPGFKPLLAGIAKISDIYALSGRTVRAVPGYGPEQPKSVRIARIDVLRVLVEK